MNFADRCLQPHIVYRIFDRADVLLYVGCTANWAGRFDNHLVVQPWSLDIVTIKIAWYPGWVEASKAEAAAIRDEQPRYNRTTHSPDQVGNAPPPPSMPRGDGVHCPKCGGTKERRRSPYCQACTRAYIDERRRAAGWTPRPPPSTTCPKCGGEKPVGPAYCRPCARVYEKERKRRKAEEARS